MFDGKTRVLGIWIFFFECCLCCGRGELGGLGDGGGGGGGDAIWEQVHLRYRFSCVSTGVTCLVT